MHAPRSDATAKPQLSLLPDDEQPSATPQQSSWIMMTFTLLADLVGVEGVGRGARGVEGEEARGEVGDVDRGEGLDGGDLDLRGEARLRAALGPVVDGICEQMIDTGYLQPLP